MNKVIDMRATYIDAKQLLKITPDADKPVRFSDISNVYFGNSAAGDINVCDPLTFQYRIKGGLPDLGTNMVTVTLENVASTSPDL